MGQTPTGAEEIGDYGKTGLFIITEVFADKKVVRPQMLFPASG
jgi:hypothetical protein